MSAARRILFDLILHIFSQLQELLFFVFLQDAVSFLVDDDSEIVSRWSQNEHAIELKEEIDRQTGADTQREIQVKDDWLVCLIDRILSPSEVDVVREPHEDHVETQAHDYES